MGFSKIKDHNFDLKPCPFCGNKNPDVYYNPDIAWYEIRCSSDRLNCILPQANALTDYEAVDKWNTRGHPYHRMERKPIATKAELRQICQMFADFKISLNQDGE